MPGNFKLMHFIYIQRIICVKTMLSTLSTLQNRLFHPEKAVLAPFVKYFELFPKKKAIFRKTECETARPAFVRVDNLVRNKGKDELFGWAAVYDCESET